MKIHRVSWLLFVALGAPAGLRAQAADPGEADRRSGEEPALVQAAIYDRPYITTAGRTSIGGYLEAHGSYFAEEGIGEGLSFAIPRFNLFVFSSIGPRLTFTSELEFEEGTEEIVLEAALLDLAIRPAFVVRGGIFVVPIGAFNQNHDSPRTEFITRPLVATEIIPATLSDVGVGVHGRLHPGRRAALPESGARDRFGGLTLTYDAYLSNGLGGGVLFGPEERTRLANGRVSGRFGESPTGRPSLSGRVALHSEALGELGISTFAGVYTRRALAGEEIDAARRVVLRALDYSRTLGPISVRGELAQAAVEVPASLRELFGERQWGGHLDLIAPIGGARRAGARSPDLAFAVRAEYVDLNVGRFAATGDPIGDEIFALVPALSWRPVPQTIVRLNYRREWARDRLRNPTEGRGGVQAGFATYF